MARKRRAVTTFCHAAFERRMGVLLSFQKASGARHRVGLTARGMLWSQVHDGVSNIPASELFDRSVAHCLRASCYL